MVNAIPSLPSAAARHRRHKCRSTPFPRPARKIEALALALAATFALAGCDRHQEEIDRFNKSQAAAKALLESQPQPQPRGWLYSERPDRIRNQKTYLARLMNDDPGSRLDQTVVLSIQQDGSEPAQVFFRSNDLSLGCATVCQIEFRAGSKTGSWLAQRTYDSDAIILLYPSEALPTITSAKSLIVQIDSNVGGQHTFKTGGFKWQGASLTSPP
jgi:hypothetical protein